MERIRLFDLPHREARRVVASGAPVYVFVNPVEYHGPHLPLHTDRLISEGLAADLHERLAADTSWPFICTADLEVGVEPTSGLGTRHVPLSHVRRVVVETCRALVELGAKRVVLMTFHGSPLHSLALDAGVQLLLQHEVRALAPLNIVLEQLIELDAEVIELYRPAVDHITDSKVKEGLLEGLPLDFHAGFFETSLMLHYAPESVGAIEHVPPCPTIVPDTVVSGLSRAADRFGFSRLAKELRLAAAGIGWSSLRPFPGYTSRPDLATADSGNVFARAIVDKYEEAAVSVFAGQPAPQPVMRWTSWLTLGGRVGNTRVPVEKVLVAS